MRTGKSILSLGLVAVKSPEGWRDAQHLPSNSVDEHGLIHSLHLPELFWPCLQSDFSLNHINCHVFVSTKMCITQWCFWLSVLNSFSFFFYSFITYVRTETLNKNSTTFIHWTFHPLPSKEAFGSLQMNARSFLFTHPRGVLPVWCWASNRQFALCCVTSLVSLSSGVCSSRVVGGTWPA